MEFKDVISKNHYRSIIELTFCFQNPENRGKNNRDEEEGLQLIHYRYALQKGAKETISLYNKARMKDFFDDKLDGLLRKNDKYEKIGWPRSIYKDCIKPGTTVNNFFKKLVKDYRLLDKKTGADGKSRYTISTRLSGEYRREGIKNALNSYNPETIDSFRIPFKKIDIKKIKEIMPDINEKTWITQTVFGMPSNFLELCNNDEKELTARCMADIREAVVILMNLKYKKKKDDSPIGIFADAMFQLRFYI